MLKSNNSIWGMEIFKSQLKQAVHQIFHKKGEVHWFQAKNFTPVLEL